MGESREITQATIGSIHFPSIHYFALFIGRCINGKDEVCHMCVPDLSVLKSAVLGDKQYTWGPLFQGGYILMVKVEICLVEFMQLV